MSCLSSNRHRHHGHLAGDSLFRGDDRLLAQGTLLVSANFLGALCNAAYHITLGRLLPDVEYAALTAMLGLILVASTPMLALQTTLAHYISLFHSAGEDRQVPYFFQRWHRALWAVAIAVAAAGVVFRGPIAAFWAGVSPALAAATVATLGLSLLMYTYYGLFQGMQSFGWLAWTPQAWGSVRFLLGLLFALTLSATALPAIFAQAIGVGAVLLLGMLALGTYHFPPLGPHRRKSTPGALPYLLGSILSLAAFALMMNIDVNLGVHYFGTEGSKLLAKAATIARTAVFLPMPVALALFPKVASTGELPPHAGRLLLRAIAFATLLIAAAGGICYAFPALPWTILYGPMSALSPDDAATAAALLRSMTLAMVPLALAYLLLNFETAQRHFLAPLLLVPCAGLYLYLVHAGQAQLGPAAIPRALLASTVPAALLLLASTLLRFLFRKPPQPEN